MQRGGSGGHQCSVGVAEQERGLARVGRTTAATSSNSLSIA